MKQSFPVLACIAVLACAGNDSTTPNTNTPRLVLDAGGSLTATVGVTDSYDLKVRFVDANGAALAAKDFTLDVSGPAKFEAVYNSNSYRTGSTASLRTDQNGAASFRIVTNNQAGHAALRFSMQQPQIVDSVTYTLLPGEAASLRIEPKDTTVYLNSDFSPRVAVVDAWGNTVQANVTMTSRSPALVLTGPTARGATVALGVLAATATAGSKQLSDSLFVSVVPSLKVATRDEFGALSLFGLNGNSVRYPSFLNTRGYQLERTPVHELLTVSGSQPRIITRYQSNGMTYPVETHRDYIATPAMTRDGQWLYYAVIGQGVERIDLLSAAVESIPQTDGARFVSLSPSGDSLLFADASSVKMRVLSSGTTSTIYSGAAMAAAWSPDGKMIAVTNGTSIRLIGTADGASRVINVIAGPVSWSPDGRYLLACGNLLTLIDMISNEIVPIKTVAGSEAVLLEW